MIQKDKVLFVCVHNSARSQIAEALLEKMAGDRFEAESAGFEPRGLNPLAVEVMKEIGIDISRNQTKSVFDLFRKGSSTPTSLRYVMKPVPKNAPFSPGSQLVSIGALPIPPGSPERTKKNWKKQDRSERP